MVAKAKFRLEGEDATAAAFRSALGNATGTANRMQAVFRTAFAGISVAAIGGIAARAIEMGDELNKAAIKAGIGGKAISELAHAAKMSDIELGALSISLRKMQVNLSEAATGGKQQQESLRALGIELKDIKSLAADKQFELIADRISQLKDPADRARAATELFGKAGADLLPMFEQGAEGIRAARVEAEKLGKSFSDEEIKRLADADTEIKKLKASWQGFAAALTIEVAPALRVVLGLLHGELPKPTLEDHVASLDRQVSFIKGETEGEIKSLERLAKKREWLLGQIAMRDGQNPYDDYASRRSRAMQPSGVPAGYKAAADAEAEAEAAAKRRKQAAKEYADVLENAANSGDNMARSLADINGASADLVDITLDQIEADKEREQYSEEMRDRMVANLQEMYFEAEKTFDGMTVYADQAARNMQDAFAEFLFDPFDDGLKGMLKGFVDILRRMAAETAAAQIFASKSEGGFGLGDLFRIGAGAVLGGGTGRTTAVPTGPSTDELFAAGPSAKLESISPSEGFSSGGSNKISVSISNHIDARNATPDTVPQIARLMERNNEKVKADIIDGIRRGKYQISPT